jgi:CubicO group peptidase (beta-lactamase class C family)
VPGAAVAVVQGGKVICLKGYGVRDVTKPGAVDENTIFQLASVTKTLTGVAAATVVDEGKLDWDKPIFNYLPEFVGYDPYMTRFLTERDLLAQRTGWPAYMGDQLDSFGYDRAEILRRLQFFKPRYSLRKVAQYSNPGFFVAGEVAARASKQSWNDLVEKRFLMLFPGATQAPAITTFAIGEDGKADSFATEALGIFTRVKEKK